MSIWHLDYLGKCVHGESDVNCQSNIGFLAPAKWSKCMYITTFVNKSKLRQFQVEPLISVSQQSACKFFTSYSYKTFKITCWEFCMYKSYVNGSLFSTVVSGRATAKANTVAKVLISLKNAVHVTVWTAQTVKLYDIIGLKGD